MREAGLMDDMIYRDERVDVPDLDYSCLGPAIEPGIYFGMDEATYRSAGAINATILKHVETSPMTAWGECVDPSGNYRKDATEAQDDGTALHTRLLEGEDVFRDRCAVLPENDGTWIDGVAELKARCKELELKVSGNTDDLCQRILEADPDAKLWARRMEDFRAETEGKLILKPEAAHQLELRARLVLLNPEIRKAFMGGFPEVSIFWIDENGMPCKGRVDYLKVSTGVDLKYFANRNAKPIIQAVNTAIVEHRIQARHYMDALKAAKILAKAGKVFGAAPDSEWMEAFAAGPEPRFSWVFVQKGKIPEIDAVEFRQFERPGASENAYWTNATNRIHFAKHTIRECLTAYGASPWVMERSPRVLKDEDQPLWSLD